MGTTPSSTQNSVEKQFIGTQPSNIADGAKSQKRHKDESISPAPQRKITKNDASPSPINTSPLKRTPEQSSSSPQPKESEEKLSRRTTRKSIYEKTHGLRSREMLARSQNMTKRAYNPPIRESNESNCSTDTGRSSGGPESPSKHVLESEIAKPKKKVYYPSSQQALSTHLSYRVQHLIKNQQKRYIDPTKIKQLPPAPEEDPPTPPSESSTPDAPPSSSTGDIVVRINKDTLSNFHDPDSAYIVIGAHAKEIITTGGVLRRGYDHESNGSMSPIAVPTQHMNNIAISPPSSFVRPPVTRQGSNSSLHALQERDDEEESDSARSDTSNKRMVVTRGESPLLDSRFTETLHDTSNLPHSMRPYRSLQHMVSRGESPIIFDSDENSEEYVSDEYESDEEEDIESEQESESNEESEAEEEDDIVELRRPLARNVSFRDTSPIRSPAAPSETEEEEKHISAQATRFRGVGAVETNISADFRRGIFWSRGVSTEDAEPNNPTVMFAEPTRFMGNPHDLYAMPANRMSRGTATREEAVRSRRSKVVSIQSVPANELPSNSNGGHASKRKSKLKPVLRRLLAHRQKFKSAFELFEEDMDERRSSIGRRGSIGARTSLIEKINLQSTNKPVQPTVKYITPRKVTNGEIVVTSNRKSVLLPAPPSVPAPMPPPPSHETRPKSIRTNLTVLPPMTEYDERESQELIDNALESPLRSSAFLDMGETDWGSSKRGSDFGMENPMSNRVSGRTSGLAVSSPPTKADKRGSGYYTAMQSIQSSKNPSFTVGYRISDGMSKLKNSHVTRITHKVNR